MYYAAFKTFSNGTGIKVTSPGEQIWFSIYTWANSMERSASYKDLRADLLWPDTQGRFAEAIISLAVSSTCKRLIDRCKFLVKRVLASNEWPYDEYYRDSIESELKNYCIDRLGFGYFDKCLAVIVPAAVDSVRVAAKKKISDEAKTIVMSEIDRGPSGFGRCYSCGVEFAAWSQITFDHVWPQSLGGTSDPENLLPACSSCNGLKLNRISWDVFGVVHDYSLADYGTDAQKHLQMALHRRAAHKFADSNGLTLKQSYLTLGPFQALDQIDPEEPRLFFNLNAHDRTVLPTLW